MSPPNTAPPPPIPDSPLSILENRKSKLKAQSLKLDPQILENIEDRVSIRDCHFSFDRYCSAAKLFFWKIKMYSSNKVCAMQIKHNHLIVK